MRHRIVLLLSALAIVGLLAALAGSAIAGPGATAAKKKKKRCPAGTHKVVIKKKNGKKKRKCVPNAPGTVGSNTGSGTATGTGSLTITPGTQDFGAVQHGGIASSSHDFTVTNTGSAASGVPSVGITEVHNPEIGGPAAFSVTANTCTVALPAGGTCTITVKFAPNSNAGDQMFSSTLDVSASPGGTVQATLTGMAQ
jgi:hypothetical protein